MKIIVGKTAGFCYGVKNAVEKSIEELEKNKDMCCLGEIVHNSKVIKDLENMGMNFIEQLEENKEKRKTIIRAHGVSKKVYEKANEKNIELVDLTCPNVLKIHKIVADYKKEGYYIFLIGAKKHPETIGTAGFGDENLSIIEEKEDIEDSIKQLQKLNKKDVLIVVQTTFSIEKFWDLVKTIQAKLEGKISNIKIINTICNATKVRQEETEEISKKVDFMIIIGGENSSNTKKLYEIAKRNCKNTICVESYEEIDKSQIQNKNAVGIMAGASTPQCSIEEIISMVKNA